MKRPNKLVLPPTVKLITDRFKKMPGVNIYLVGGAVRDWLLKKNTNDFDLVISGLPLKKLENELKKIGKVIYVGKTFGVYKLIANGQSEAIDIALPRLDHSLNTGRYRDVRIKTDYKLNIDQDLKRRDFTINALAINLKTKEIIDLNNGQKHLQAGILSTVESPLARFQEDYSRILRALRFSIQLGFKIENKTWLAIKKLSKKAVTEKMGSEFKLPREAIAKEFLKSLFINPVGTIQLWDKAGILETLFPEITVLKKTPQAKIFHSEGNVYKHTLLALSAAQSKEWKKFFGKTGPSISVILALLFHDIGKAKTMKWVFKHRQKIISTPDHDNQGALMAKKIMSELKLTSFGDKPYKIDADLVEWLVAKHMLLVHGQISNFKPSTIYKYFLAQPDWGLALQQVIFCDSWATRPSDGRVLFDRLIELRKKIKSLVPLLNKKGELTLLLNGSELIKIFNLLPGPKVGELLKTLSDGQLSGKVKTKQQAVLYLKKQL